jgi:NADPH:quinone reductase-like Zn-dependent oxidoreductase
MPEDGVLATIPENMSYEEAVPVPGGGITAAKILKKGKVQAGQKVLIYGASGNVGTFAVQIADYTTTDFTKSSETYDLVFDAVGKMDSSQRKVSLTESGIYLNVDKDSGGMGKSADQIEYLVLLKELMEEGNLKSVIDSTYTFEQIPEAHTYVETGRKRGSIVVTVDHD